MVIEKIKMPREIAYCFQQMIVMYPASMRNRTRRALVQLVKNSGQLAPIAIPSEIKAILSKFPYHHFKVKDLKRFILK